MYFTRTYSERTIHRFDGLFDGLERLFGAVRCLELFALTHRPSVADTDTGRSYVLAPAGFVGVSDDIGYNLAGAAPHKTLAAHCVLVIKAAPGGCPLAALPGYRHTPMPMTFWSPRCRPSCRFGTAEVYRARLMGLSRERTAATCDRLAALASIALRLLQGRNITNRSDRSVYVGLPLSEREG